MIFVVDVKYLVGADEEEEVEEEPLGDEDDAATSVTASSVTTSTSQSYNSRPTATATATPSASKPAISGGDLLDLYDSAPAMLTKPTISVGGGSVNFLDDLGISAPKLPAVTKSPIVAADVRTTRNFVCLMLTHISQ